MENLSVESLNTLLAKISDFLWGMPMVITLLIAAFSLTIYLKGIQFWGFWHAIKVVRGKYDEADDPGDISHFKALCTALSATVGLGNIAGVAIAISLGGPGATVWMILAGFLGMATKFTECSLASIYRKFDEKGLVAGGPMYYIENGLGPKFKPLAVFYAICCIFTACGAANMFQANQVAVAINGSFDIHPLVTGIVMAILVSLVIVGGIKRIGSVADVLVPVMGVAYVIGCLIILSMNIPLIPEMFIQMFSSAINGHAALGGFTGASVSTVITMGLRRALFSNEAGLGSAAIAHAAAKTKDPVSQGFVAMLEPFVDTVVVCTMTALVINITGTWHMDIVGGVAITQAAFDSQIAGFGSDFIPIAVFLFAFSTIISWNYYGTQSTYYIFGRKGLPYYNVIYIACIVIGSIWAAIPIINFSDSSMALMVIPNIIAMVFLARKVKAETWKYWDKYENSK